MGKNSQITTGISPNRLIPLVILFTLIFRFSFSLLTPFFFWKSKEKRQLPGSPLSVGPAPTGKPGAAHLGSKAKCPDP